MAVGQSASKADLGDLVARLRTMAQGRSTIDVAQLHFVELNDIKQAYGDRWPDQKSRIQDTAEAFLQRRISGSDLLIRGDSGFLVVLGSAVGPDAHAVTAQLTHGLNAFFLGGGQSPAPKFGGVAQVMPAHDIAACFGDLDVLAPGPARHDEKTGLPGLDWRFEPVWDVKREALSYWFAAAYSSNNGVRVPGYQFENGALHPNQFVKIDEAGLWVAEQALHDLFAAQRPTLVGASVHVASLANLSSRARILATIDRLDPALHRYRILKIAGVSSGFPRMYLNEIVGILKARVPNVVIGAAWDEPDVAGLVHSRPLAVGFAVPTSGVTSGPVIAIPALMAKVNEAVKQAHAGRARIFVEGAVTKYLALKFATAGVDNIASPRIWPALPMVQGMMRWPAQGLAAA
ncbi:MAG TPA: hypothetical protein VGO52_04990 [Hyphomonadaceae bacterium]|jgi:hypothetical protein|nr:hypothetical protein [Hyphomonadaceae bacterium]